MNYRNINDFVKRQKQIEEQKEKRILELPSVDQHIRVAESNRIRAMLDDTYAPAGVSRNAWDDMLAESQEKQRKEKEQTDKRKNIMAQRSRIKTDREQKIENQDKLSYRTRGLGSPTAKQFDITELPSVDTHQTSLTFAEDVARRKSEYDAKSKIKTLVGTRPMNNFDILKMPLKENAFTEDVARRKSEYDAAPKIKTLFGEKKATAVDLLKQPAPVDENTPRDFDYEEDYYKKIMTEASNGLFGTDTSSNVNSEYTTDEQRAAAKEKYTKMYYDAEAKLKEIQQERRNRDTYENVLNNDKDFWRYATQGKNIPIPSWDSFVTPVNKIEYYLKNLPMLELEVASGGSSAYQEEEKYRYITDRERAIYNYYIGRGDYANAENYLQAIDDDLKNRYAKWQSDFVLDNKNPVIRYLGPQVASLSAGVGNGVSGIGEAFNRYILLDENPYSLSVNQRAYQYMRPQLGGLEGMSADLLYSTGNMLPSIAVGSLAGPEAGAIVMGISVMGDSYAEARREGKTDEEASNYAILEGIKEAGLSYLLGGIDKLGKAGGSKLLGKSMSFLNKSKTISSMARNVSKVIDRLKLHPAVIASAKTVGKYVVNMGDEALEEYIQEILDPIVRNIAFGENNEFKPFSEQALYAAALGAISAGVYNFTGLPQSYRENYLDSTVDARNTAEKVLNGQTEALPPVTESVSAPTANAANEDTAIHVGRATTIYNPYTGKVPQQTQNYTPQTVSISRESVDNADKNIVYARMSNVRNFKSELKQIYNNWFDSRKGRNSVVVNGVTFDGKPYTVSLGKRVVGKVISDPNFSTEKMAVFDVIDEIIKNGKYVGSSKYVAKNDKTKKTVRFDYFETNAKIGDQEYIVSFDVEVFPVSNNYRTHKLNKIELNSVTGGDVNPSAVGTDVGPAPTAATKNSTLDKTIPQSLPDVNSKTVILQKKIETPPADTHTADGRDEAVPLPEPPPLAHEAIQNLELPPIEDSAIPHSPSPPFPESPPETTMDSLYGWARDREQMQNEQWQNRAGASQDIPYTTETPRKKTSLERRAAKFKDEFERKFVDSGYAVTQISKITNDQQLYAYYNNARQTQNAGQYMITKAQTDINGKKIGKSLDEIFAPIKKKGQQYLNEFTEFLLHRHNIDRWQVNRPIDFAEGYELPKSKAIVERHLRNHPEFQQLAEDVYAYNRNLLQYRVDAGLITQAFANQMNEQYPHYVPTHRKNDKQYFPLDTISEEIARVGTGIKTAKGSSEEVLPIYEQMSKITMQTVSQAKRNIFANRLADAIYTNPMETSAYANMPKDADGIYDLDNLKGDSLKDNLLVYHRQGKAESMEIGTSLMEAVRELTNQGRETPGIVKIGRFFNKMFRATITEYNPLFTLRNFARDFPDALFASKNTKEFIKSLPAAVKEMTTNGEIWQQFEALGGSASPIYKYKYDSGTFKKHFGFRRVTFDKISQMNEFVEMIPRFTEFYATLKNGDGSYTNLMQAMHNAADITVNFQRGGSWVKPMNSTLTPYLNASIQGFSKNIRMFTETKGGKAWARLIFKAAILGFAPKLINEFLLGDDEEYQELKENVKLNNFIIKTDDNHFLKVPTGRLTGVLGSLSSSALRAIRGGEVDAANLVWNAMSQVGPVNILEQNLIQPIYNANNNRTWYGGKIENKRLQELPPAERYDSNTSEIGKTIGRGINKSPKKIDYLIDSYTGIIGDVLLPMTTNPDSGNVDPGERIKDVLYKAFVGPAEKSFIVNSTFSNKTSESYYKKADILTQAANSQYASTVDKVTLKYYNSQNDALSELYQQLRDIESDTDYSRTERQELSEDIQRQINDTQRTIMQNVERYAAVAQKYKNLDKNTAYLMTNRDVFGAQKALQMAGKTVYQKAQEAVANGASYDNYVEYTRRVWAIPEDIKDDDKAYNAEKNKIIRDIKWANPEQYIISKMSESKQNKYAQVKSSFGQMTAANYNKIVEGYNKVKGTKNNAGKTISGSKKANQIKYLQSVGFNYAGAVLFRKIMESN